MECYDSGEFCHLVLTFKLPFFNYGTSFYETYDLLQESPGQNIQRHDTYTM